MKITQYSVDIIQLWQTYSPYGIILSGFFLIGLIVFQNFTQSEKNHTLHNLFYGTIAFGLIFSGIELLNRTNPELQPLFTAINFILLFSLPCLWNLYNTSHANKKKYSSGNKKIIFLFVVLFLLLLITNFFTPILWEFKTHNTETVLIYHPAYLITALFAITTLITGGIYLFKQLTLPFYIFRWQAIGLLSAILIPLAMIANEKVLNSFLLPPIPLTAYSFLFSGWMINKTRTHFRLNDILTISRASFFENITDAIVIIDAKNKILDINPAAKLIISPEADRALSQPLEQTWPELAKYIQRLSENKEKITYIALDHLNKKHYYDIEISPFLDWSGAIISKIIVLHDITEQKVAEENLRKSEEKFRSIIEQSIDGILIINERSQILEWNKGMEKITGIPREQMLYKTLIDLYVDLIYPQQEEPFSYDEVNTKIQEALGSGRCDWFNNYAESCIVNSEGYNRLIQHQSFPIKTSEGYSFASIIRDITDKRQLENERIKSGKLESLGILAGGIAHDFNNILTAIIGNISLAKMFSQEEKILTFLTEGEKATGHARELTQQLLTFSKGGVPIRKTTSIVNIIKNAASFSLRGSNVKYEFFIDDEIWPVDVDIGQINQVISNLMINADHSMTSGGTIRISVSNTILKTGEIPRLSPGQYVKISIMDEGNGIPPEILNKIFDPYFSTKKTGSGLGLAIVYSIIKKHQGYIHVNSIEGVGTNFTIYLAASDSPLEEAHEIIGKNKEFQGKILIMDDEPSIRRIVRQMLELLGHKVEVASDGSEAISLYKRALINHEPFDAVIMDLTVPGGMGGKAAMLKLMEIDSDIKAIVSSGYSNDPVLSNHEKYGFKGFLMKPYKISELEETLNSLF